MDDLRKMWEICGLVEDQNNDNVADRVNIWINLEQGFHPDGLIDFCARLGFETTSLSFDFFQKNKKHSNELVFIQNNHETTVQWVNNELILNYKDEERLSDLLRFLAGKWHVNFGDENTRVKKIILSDEKIILEDESEELKEYSLNSNDLSPSNRQYNMENLTDVWSQFGFLHENNPSPINRHAVTFRPHKDLPSEAWVEMYYGAARIGMESTALAFPLTGKHSKNSLTLIFQSTESKKANIQLKDNSIYFSGNNKSLLNAISYFFREKHWSFGGHYGTWENQRKILPPEEKLFDFTWEDPGEVKELYQSLDELKDNNDSSEQLDMNIFISEPKDIRDVITQDIKKKFSQANVVVRSAYKPGYFWLMEEILPILKTLNDHIGFIKIKCLKEDRIDGLELPIRWIQELYPVDEMFSNDLRMNLSNVDFELCEDLDATYKICVYDNQNHLLYNNQINIPVSKVPYVEDGKYSYPTTSFLSVFKQDKQLIHSIIKTDRERFYMYYTENILPKLWDMSDRTDENSGFLKPLFDRIEIEVTMSEEELKIPVEEERISSLEALHEDLYFNTLDYFGVKGEQTVGKAYTAPGGIYPFLKINKGTIPSAKISAYKWVEQQAENVLTKQLSFTNEKRTPTEVTYHIGEDIISKSISKHIKLDSIPKGVFQPKIASVRPWLVEYSYRGEPIFAYEFFKDIKEEYYSAIKLSVFKPTVLIETGHHANEVSSMPAVVELMDEISQMHSEIINNINIVVIPRANPDGTALHERMIKDNPEWKHHAARYNAVGLEFSDVRYLNSIFGEGNVVPNIMNRWAPDILIDDHGIPSHEWTQPFAGYHIPPRFNMSFWIPNAMLYGIARQLNEVRYPQHKAVLDKITHSIQQKVKGTNIHDLNHYWVNRYKKYGNRFMPELFPIELTGDLIFYKWPTKTDSESQYAISRFPDWVSAELISEVADETVYGESLEICKKAHRIFDLGAIEWIRKDNQSIKKIYYSDEICIFRVRPLQL